MQRLNSQLHLFGWGNRSTTEGSSLAGAEASATPAAPRDPARVLERLCLGPNVPAILKPLTPTVTLITQQLLQGQAVPAAAVCQLAAAAEFLKPAESAERQLEHALSAHRDKVALRSFLDNVGAALSVLCQTKGLPGKAPPLKAALAIWQRDAEAFMDFCRDVWELHAYFVFLDVKGDRALLETTALQLCATLGCTMSTLMASAARTGPWVQETLKLLAEQRLAEVLAQRHVRALQQWRAMWQERLQQLPQEHQLRLRMPGASASDGDKTKSRPTAGATEEKGPKETTQHLQHLGGSGPGPGCIFWENYFNQLFIVAWPDFAEALEDHFFLGRCPTDILKRLRRQLPNDQPSAEKVGAKTRNRKGAKKRGLQFPEEKETVDDDEKKKKMMMMRTRLGERTMKEKEEEEKVWEEEDEEDEEVDGEVDGEVETHQVSRSSWQHLLKEHEDSLPSLADALLGEVLADVSACIFRRKPLVPLGEKSRRSCSAGSSGGSSGGKQPALSQSSQGQGQGQGQGRVAPPLSHAPAALAALASATTQQVMTMAKTAKSSVMTSSTGNVTPSVSASTSTAASTSASVSTSSSSSHRHSHGDSSSLTSSAVPKRRAVGAAVGTENTEHKKSSGAGRQQQQSSNAGSSCGRAAIAEAEAEPWRRRAEENKNNNNGVPVPDTTSATPLDPHRLNCPIGEGEKVPWGNFLAHLHKESPRWWSRLLETSEAASPCAGTSSCSVNTAAAAATSASASSSSSSSSSSWRTSLSSSSLAPATAKATAKAKANANNNLLLLPGKETEDDVNNLPLPLPVDAAGNKLLGPTEEHWEAALRVVSSSNLYTNRAIILRVVSGDLARGRPLLLMQPQGGASTTKDEDFAVPTTIPPTSSTRKAQNGQQASLGHADHLPALVVTANGSRFNGITKFGRGSSRKLLLPDLAMSEPIASRSHFNVVYEAESDCFSIMDAGSKWGTFVKITEPVPLNCGDWIRVGNAEFVIRHCGGRCKSHKQHKHHKLQSLRLANQHFGRAVTRSLNESTEMGPVRYGEQHGESSDDDSREQLKSELKQILAGHRRPHPTGWSCTATRICQSLVGSLTEETSQSPLLSLPAAEEEAQPAFLDGANETSLILAPVPPLEIDFISGPRMGEKIVLTDRICTLGRGEGSTVQVSDPMLANVSRTHCIFEYSGGRWKIRDNGSTNGTWRRLSCVLVPSKPIPLKTGMSILAGVHEFLVEEAEMPHCWLPSMASVSLAELCEHEQQLVEQACPQIAGS